MVAVPARLEVEHEADEGALKAGALAGVDGEAGSADFGGAFEIDEAFFFGDFPVGFEVVAGWLFAPGADDDVFGFVFAIGDGGVGEVGELEFDLVKAVFELFGLGFEVFDGLFEVGGLGFGGFGLFSFALAHELADGLADAIAFGLFLFEFDEDFAPMLVDGEELVERGFDAFAAGRGEHRFGVFADEFSVEHDGGNVPGAGRIPGSPVLRTNM